LKIIAFEGIDGVGKTTLLNAVEADLSRKGVRVHIGNLTAGSIKNFKIAVGNEYGTRGKYQKVIPYYFRNAAYVTEAVLMFEHFSSFYESFDILLFDRWFPLTFEKKSDLDEETKATGVRLLSLLPEPNLVFLLDAPLEVAAARLRADDDWMCDMYDEVALLEKLRKKREKYYGLKDREGIIWLNGAAPRRTLFDQAIHAIKDRFESF
jgi:thymidylate kinase